MIRTAGFVLMWPVAMASGLEEAREKTPDAPVENRAGEGESVDSQGQEQADDLGDLMEEVTVVASRIGRPWIQSSGSVTSIRPQELTSGGVQDLGGIGKYDPLISAPFDYGSSDTLYGYGGSGYSGFNIRGVEGNRVSMELDGIRQPPQYVSTSFDMGTAGGSGGMGRDYFDPSMFSLIEILKGGGSALYGSDAMGGVVSLKTIDAGDLLNGKEWGALARTQYFSVNDSYAWQAGGAVESGAFRAMLMYSGREGHESENHGGGSSTRPNPVDFSSHAILGKFDWSLGDHRFQLAVESYERDTHVNTLSAVRESALGGFNDYVLDDQTMERQRASVRWEFEPKAEWADSIEAMVYWQSSMNRSDNHSGSRDRDIGGVVIPGRKREQTINFETNLYGIQLQGRKEREWGTWKHQLLSGLDISMEESVSTFERWDTGNVQDTNRTPFAPADTLRAGFYLQDEIGLAEKWSLTPGLRFDYTSIDPEVSAEYRARLAELRNNNQFIGDPEKYDNFAVSPRLDIAYMPTEGTRIYGNYSLGIRNPTAEELSMVFVHSDVSGGTAGTVTTPNPDLEEETSHSFELGFKADGDAGRFQMAGFYNRYRNYIENGVFTGEFDQDGREIRTTVNRGEAEIYGGEMGGELSLGHWLPVLDGAKIGAATGISFGKNTEDGAWLNSVEPWKSSIFAGYDAPSGKYGVRLTGTYVDRVRRVDDTIPETGVLYRPEAYFLLDLAAYWKPTDSLTINGGINNLLDQKYWSWSSARRTSSGSTGDNGNERNTGPGTNFHVSLTYQF